MTLRFSPPRLYTTPSGEVPFAVKVIPSNEPEESVTEESMITVGSFNDVGAELVPRVTTGRITGRQKLAVDSRGNVPLPVEVSALDAADALKFKIRPSALTTAPGEARFIRVKVKPRQRFWKGPEQHKPYKVQVAPADEKPLVLDGSLTQKSVLPKWLLTALLIAAAAALLWFFVLKPAVHSTAVNANKAALAAQANQTKALQSQLAATQSSVARSSAAQASNAAALAALAKKSGTTVTTTTTTIPTTTTVKAAGAAATTTTTTVAKGASKVVVVPPVAATTVPGAPPTTQPAPVTGPNDGRIEVVAAPGSSATNSITLAPQSNLQIEDLIIQNVSDTGGRASIQRLPAGPGAVPEDLLVENLGSLTDQEYTFSSPIVFTSGQQLILSVTCTGDQPACDVGVYFTGPLTVPAGDTPPTFP